MSHQKKLKEILSQRTFEELEPFKNTTLWPSLDRDDRNLLASLFIMQGEKQLENGDSIAKESFDLATKVASENYEVYQRIGLAYAMNQFNVTALRLGEEYVKKSLSINSDNFMSWCLLGRINNNLGMLVEETLHFEEADSCFAKGFELSQNESEIERAMLYWQWAVSWYCLGKHSGEAVDFYKALDKFRHASLLGQQDKYFWSNYGDTLAELAMLLGRNELFADVVELYRNAIRQAFDFFEGWLSMGCAFHKLFEVYLNDEDFHQAHECFKMASQINDNHPTLYSRWAQLIAQAGKWKNDENLVRESLDKFKIADALDPENPLILCLWGETLLLYGAQGEKIDALREAEEKIVKSLDLQHDVADAWYMYGCCLNEQGRYFNQEDYYHKAIEKFQYGLTLKQTEPLLWYGLALSHLSIGELKGDLAWLEQAVRLFARVVEYGGEDLRPLWNDWGITLMKIAEITGQKSPLESAIEKFETIIPNRAEEWDDANLDSEWLYNYGCALDFLGDFTEEISCYEKAVQALAKTLQLDPHYSHARYNLALALSHLGELAMDVESFHKSIEHFQILLSQDPEDEMGWNDYGLTLLHLAQLIYDPIRPEHSQKLYEVAESKFMQSAALGCTQAYYNLSCLYTLMGNFELAMHYLEKSENAGTLPPVDELLTDEWLEPLRETQSFKTFMNNKGT